ncbi:hypothetical protein H0H92_010728 [Tricholoma furcatifolium]|nr:hypothetical protein H0H92_010728 [Tricholoma furcatifolium]
MSDKQKVASLRHKHQSPRAVSQNCKGNQATGSTAQNERISGKAAQPRPGNLKNTKDVHPVVSSATDGTIEDILEAAQVAINKARLALSSALASSSRTDDSRTILTISDDQLRSVLGVIHHTAFPHPIPKRDENHVVPRVRIHDESPSTTNRSGMCLGFNRKGEKCGKQAKSSGYCSWHAPSQSKCAGINKDGNGCKNPAPTDGSRDCHKHKPRETPDSDSNHTRTRNIVKKGEKSSLIPRNPISTGVMSFTIILIAVLPLLSLTYAARMDSVLSYDERPNENTG